MNMEFQPPMGQRALRDIVAEYEEKAGAIPATLAAFNDAMAKAETACNIGGAYGGRLFPHGTTPSEHQARAALLKSAWRHVYQGLHINTLATAKERKAFDLTLEDPPEFTLDNIRATFGEYVLDPRFSILKGLAEVFGDLDPAYKSHSKVKIGVQGLPKRIILHSFGSYGSWGYDRLRDTLNALNTYAGRPHVSHNDLRELIDSAGEHGAGYYHGVELRTFQNGNGHLIFDPETLREVNLALAEFYGDVLPDTPDEPRAKRQSTAVSKDLQFYRTPDAIADRLVSHVTIRDGYRMLEPSCGDGSLLRAFRRYVLKHRLQNVGCMGIETHAGRAEKTRQAGFNVLTANFLQCSPVADFDLVLMNPPFYGKHYQKHVEHARRFLKPGGVVAAILPVTAYTDHGFVDRHNWRDLPTAAFRESGTNINTGIATFGPA